jgi:hypothetical protein
MKYILVFQWSLRNSIDYKEIHHLEDLIEANIVKGSEVDGHDIGSGEMNIFIATNEPVQAFDSIKLVLEQHDKWTGVRAAFRETGGEIYTILWPKDLRTFDVA